MTQHAARGRIEQDRGGCETRAVRAFLIAIDFVAALVLVPLGTVAALLGEESWWIPGLALVYLATFSRGSRTMQHRVATWFSPDH